MDKETHMYDALGKWKPVAVKAVISARFENATQTFNKLCLKFLPFAKVLPPTSSHIQHLDDAFSRLGTWGQETGAEDQSLDHRLRMARDMHETVVEALRELQLSLDDTLKLLEEDTPVSWKDQLDKDEADIKTWAQLESARHDSASLDPPGEPGFVGSHTETDEFLEAMSDLIDLIEANVLNLVMLGPSLEHPYPQDVDAYSTSLSGSSDTSDQGDIERARLEFPFASDTLQKRLGHANWKRRIMQLAVQGQRQHKGDPEPTSSKHKQVQHKDVAEDAFNFQKPTLKSYQKSGSKQSYLHPMPSVAASSVSFSESPSLFDNDHGTSRLSRTVSMTTLATTTTVDSKIPQLGQPAHASNRLNTKSIFPRAPMQFTTKSIESMQSFTCKLCGYDFEVGGKIRSEEDWRQHVLVDLAPYLCTFDECFSAQEMYSQRDEWYLHELESHRIKTVWACSACAAEFESKHEATEHTTQCHCDYLHSDREVAMMTAMVRQGLSKKRLGPQRCPFCTEKVHAGSCKEHISQHLEYFALLSIPDEDAFEGNCAFDYLLQDEGDVSERVRKDQMLNAFVSEQLNLNLLHGKIPSSSSYQNPDSASPHRPQQDLGPSDASLLSMETNLAFYGKNYSKKSIREPDEELDNSIGAELSAPIPTSDSKSLVAAKSLSSAKIQFSTGRGNFDLRIKSDKLPKPIVSSEATLPLLRTWSSPRQPGFTGRTQDLLKLNTILSKPGRVCVLSGEGGMGKTSLAVEYTWFAEYSFHYVFWVDAQTQVSSNDTFCQIARQLQLATKDADHETLIRLGREFLEKVEDKRWLMVLDNVDKWEDIDPYVPTKTFATQGSILITTRHEHFTAPSRPVNYFRVHLKELSADEGRALLIQGLPEELRPRSTSLDDEEYKVAGQIASLAGLPQLIVYVSGYIKKSGITLTEFWEYWSEWRLSARAVSGKRPESSERDSVLHVTLGDLGNDELKVLKIMAFLNSNGIQPEALEWSNESKPGPTYLKKNRLRVIMSKLKGQNLVLEKTQGDRQIYNVHKLLLSKLMQDMNTNKHEQDEIFGIAYDLIRAKLPRPSLDPHDQAKWEAFNDYLPLLLSLQRAYADQLSVVSITPFLGLAELFKDGGVLLWQRYIHDDALKLLLSAEGVLDELGEVAAVLRCEINVTINLLLQYFGIQYRKEIRDRASAILDLRGLIYDQKNAENQASQDDAVRITDAYADFGNATLQFNDYRLAEAIYTSCVSSYKGVPNSDEVTFALAKLNHHLAYCKMYKQEFDEALAMSARAVSMVEHFNDMTMTLRYKFDLACIMLQAGALEDALVTHRAIFAARLGFQGRASYFTLQSQYAVASLCHCVGQIEEAETLMRSALGKAADHGGKNFWPEAAVARAKYHLALMMADQEKVAAEQGDDNDEGGQERRHQRHAEARQLSIDAKDVLSRMLPYDPEPITGVREEDTLALFDHLQPVFGGRFTSTKLLRYVSRE